MKISLTYNEAAILISFGEACEASVPDLAVSARLTPAEAQEALKSLQKKELIDFFDGKIFVRLTTKGDYARCNWILDSEENPRNILYGSSKEGNWGVESVDDVLKREIDKL